MLSRSLIGGRDGPAANEHAFDLEAEVEPIADMTAGDGAGQAGGDQGMGGFMDDFDQGDDDMDTESGETELCEEGHFCSSSTELHSELVFWGDFSIFFSFSH